MIDSPSYRPAKSALRLSKNAREPSRKSSVITTWPKRSASSASASARPSEPPSTMDRFVASTASGAFPAMSSAMRPASASRASSGVDPLDQADAQGLRSVDHLAREAQVHRHPLADQPRHALRPAVARKDPEVHLGLAELGVLARDPDVARHRELAPAAEREAVDRRDHRHAHPLDLGGEPLAFARLRLGGARVRQRVQLADVRAGSERFGARAGEDHRAQVLLAVELREGLAQLVEHPNVKSI